MVKIAVKVNSYWLEESNVVACSIIPEQAVCKRMDSIGDPDGIEYAACRVFGDHSGVDTNCIHCKRIEYSNEIEIKTLFCICD